MYEISVLIARVSLRIRHATSLKDRRKVVQSLVQKFKNYGFSVTETGTTENAKQASLGLAYVSKETFNAHIAVDEMKKILMGDFEILNLEHEIVTYEDIQNETMDWEHQDERD